jgi:probable phosphoglycerate mutase
VRVLLVRHGECADNVVEHDAARLMDAAAFAAWVAGVADSPLTERGCAQAAELAERLRGEGIERLYASPLPRARDTAAAVGGALGLAPVTLDALRELTPVAARRAAHGPVPMRRLLRPATVRMFLSPASPDRLPAALGRVRGAWEEITREPAGTVAVVTHGWVIVLLTAWLRLHPRWRVRNRDLSNCGISVVQRR